MSFQHQVLGTIISSVLDFDQLCNSIGEPAAIDLARSSYVPCDGRPINGSSLNRITRQAHAPDLRGKFVRGLNVIYNVGQPLPFDPQQNGDPGGANRTAGDFQTDAMQDHTHGYQRYQPLELHDISNDHDQRGVANISNNTGDSTGGSSGRTAVETRPRNIAVYFYLKIN